MQTTGGEDVEVWWAGQTVVWVCLQSSAVTGVAVRRYCTALTSQEYPPKAHDRGLPFPPTPTARKPSVREQCTFQDCDIRAERLSLVAAMVTDDLIRHVTIFISRDVNGGEVTVLCLVNPCRFEVA